MQALPGPVQHRQAVVGGQLLLRCQASGACQAMGPRVWAPAADLRSAPPPARCTRWLSVPGGFAGLAAGPGTHPPQAAWSGCSCMYAVTQSHTTSMRCFIVAMCRCLGTHISLAAADRSTRRAFSFCESWEPLSPLSCSSSGRQLPFARLLGWLSPAPPVHTPGVGPHQQLLQMLLPLTHG